MNVEAAVRGVRDGRRKAVALQRRLWLAQLALWPTAILMAVAVSTVAWLLWPRNSRDRAAGTFTAAPAAVDAPEPSH